MNNVLVTGCSRGLGVLICDELHDRGCFVLPHFRIFPQNLLKNAVAGDITDSTTLDKIELALDHNNINVFVNNAAIHQRKLFLEHSDEDIEKIVNVNITAQIKLLKRVYAHFVNKGDGLIININSIAALQPAPGETIYSSTKHALKGFSQSLQVESIGKNVRIVDIFPGAMKTDMTRSRENYSTLIDPREVASRVGDIIGGNNMTSLETEVVIRKFNRG